MVHDIQSRLLLLPSELKHLIAELSSHDSLSSLARTHTAFRIEAEQALYCTLSNPPVKCLKTLATNSEKAGFVRFLTMEYVYYNTLSPFSGYGGYSAYPNDLQRAKRYLLDALVNMRSLSDLRLRMPRNDDMTKPWMERLDKILCDNHFRLQTLYSNELEFLDLSQIIESQTELQMLGIYEFDYEKFKFFRSLERLQLHLPVVVSLEWVQLNIHNHFRKIGIFPAFYSIDRYPTFYQVLAESFDKDRSSYTLANSDAGKPSALDIYLVDSCDIPSIHVLTKNMTMRFPGLTSLTFCFENPCEISSDSSQEIKKIISLFLNLLQLQFVRWPFSVGCDNGDKNIPENIKMAHVKDWELACPGLRLVSFIDGSILVKMGIHWGPYQRYGS